MEVLNLSEIVGYLPYGLKVLRPDRRTILQVEGIANGIYIFTENGFPENTYGDLLGSKPILRNLSDLTKEIEVDGEKFVPKQCLFMGDKSYVSFKRSVSKNAIHCNDYWLIKKLYSWHFDIHNLINRGLAIDINTI